MDSSTNLKGIDFQLRPEAVIRGTVTDATGRPVANLSVSAVRQEKAAKVSEDLVRVAGSRTDARGQFVVRGLPAATYLVCANGPAGYGVTPNAGGCSLAKLF